MINYVSILTRCFPNTEWSLIGSNYDDLIWLSDTPKPSKATIEALWDEVQADIQTEIESKESAKATAQAKLEALGLTADDLRALGL